MNRSPVVVKVPLRGIFLAHGSEQLFAEELRIGLCQPENRGEHPSLVPPARMRRIQAVVSQFGDIRDSALNSWQLHLA